MTHGHANLPLALGILVSLAAHVGVGTWLATTPAPTPVSPVARFDARRDLEVPLALDPLLPPPAEPVPTPTDPIPPAEPVKATVPPEPAPKPPEIAPPPPPPPPPPPTADLRLGIAESEAKEAQAFLGEAVATPHSAPHSEVDQPALSKAESAAPGVERPKGTDDGSMTPSETPTEEASASDQQATSLLVPIPDQAPTPDAASSPSEATPAKPLDSASEATDASTAPAAAPVPDRGVTVAEVEQLIAPAIQASEIAAEAFGQVMRVMPSIGVVWVPMPGTGAEELTQTKPSDSTGTQGEEPTPKAATPVVAPSKPPSPAPTTTSAPLGTPIPGLESKPQGEKSNKESNPYSINETLKFEAGKPLAIKGLEVQTTNPVISDVALITGNPLNPTVEIAFNAKGKAVRVEFLKSTGRKDWDDPIDHAMHEWTISGELLTKLQREKPNGVITIRVRILLR
ncbi:MAG: hypothetical protein AABZ53_01970 [Planctomycetota bacterium]